MSDNWRSMRDGRASNGDQRKSEVLRLAQKRAALFSKNIGFDSVTPGHRGIDVNGHSTDVHAKPRGGRLLPMEHIMSVHVNGGHLGTDALASESITVRTMLVLLLLLRPSNTPTKTLCCCLMRLYPQSRGAARILIICRTHSWCRGGSDQRCTLTAELFADEQIEGIWRERAYPSRDETD